MLATDSAQVKKLCNLPFLPDYLNRVSDKKGRKIRWENKSVGQKMFPTDLFPSGLLEIKLTLLF